MFTYFRLKTHCHALKLANLLRSVLDLPIQWKQNAQKVVYSQVQCHTQYVKDDQLEITALEKAWEMLLTCAALSVCQLVQTSSVMSSNWSVKDTVCK